MYQTDLLPVGNIPKLTYTHMDAQKKRGICIIFCQLLSMPAVFFFISVRNMHLLRVSGNNVYPAIPAVPVSPAD